MFMHEICLVHLEVLTKVKNQNFKLQNFMYTQFFHEYNKWTRMKRQPICVFLQLWCKGKRSFRAKKLNYGFG